MCVLFQEDFDSWLSVVYSQLDNVTCNSITLLRYKLKYREELNNVDLFLLIGLGILYAKGYGKVKQVKPKK